MARKKPSSGSSGSTVEADTEASTKALADRRMRVEAAAEAERGSNKYPVRIDGKAAAAIGSLDQFRRECAAMRMAGMSTAEIALHAAAQGRVVTEENVKRYIEEHAEAAGHGTRTYIKTQTVLELDRLDALTKTLWTAASDGDLMAVDRILKIQQRRAALLGLDAPETRATFSVTAEASDVDLSKLSPDELKTMLELQMKMATQGAPEVPERDVTPKN